MKKSQLRQIIQEEIKAVLEAEDPIQTSFRDALKKKGAEFSSGGGNRLKEKEYTFGYAYWYGDGDYDFDSVTVKASNEQEARDLAYTEAKEKHRSVRTSKEKFNLTSVK